MDGDLKRKLFDEIDKCVLEKQLMNPETSVAELMKPEVVRLSSEYNIDVIELFTTYMDHITIKSKSFAQSEAGQSMDFDKEDIKLY